MGTLRADAVIIGGGASGLFCACQLGLSGVSVIVIEHSGKLGKKLRITGKGRCNVTNNCDMETVMNNIPENARFMYSSLSRWKPEDTMAFFEGLGVPLKTERGNRVFPVSDNANDIADALVGYCKDLGVRFLYDEAKSLIIENGSAVGVLCERERVMAGSVIVACGGRSYPGTGSTGDGYRFARAAGHTVTDITPSLCPVVVQEREECAGAMGLSLRNCTLTLKEEGTGKKLYSQLGELLFTHFGLSGPLVLSASAHMRDLKNKSYRLEIDLKPALDMETLDKRLRHDFDDFPNRIFQNSLGRLLPAKLIPLIVKRSGIDPEKRVNQLTREERRGLCELLKCLSFRVKSMRPIEEAIITRGGVSLKEIDPRTMGSKLVDGLYFIGEVLDVDAYTGGFNLQIAFSTAFACAQSAADRAFK